MTGGQESRRSNVLSSTELLEVDKSTEWKATNPLPSRIYLAAAITLKNEVFLTGFDYKRMKNLHVIFPQNYPPSKLMRRFFTTDHNAAATLLQNCQLLKTKTQITAIDLFRIWVL